MSGKNDVGHVDFSSPAGDEKLSYFEMVISF